jgi:hypothetical protein
MSFPDETKLCSSLDIAQAKPLVGHSPLLCLVLGCDLKMSLPFC